MISARRAALLGLTVPLSAIMIAVLGLWPEVEEQRPSSTGGGSATKAGKRQEDPIDLWDPWADRLKRDRILRNRRLMVMTAIAYAEQL